MKHLIIISTVFLLSISLFSQENEKRLALVITNLKYDHAGELTYPANSSEEMGIVLKELGFTVLYYEDCNLRKMKIAIDDFNLQLKSYEVGLVYYFGHAAQLKGYNYFIPVNAKVEHFNEVEFECIKIERLLSGMEMSETKINIVILDACRENMFDKLKGNSSGMYLATMNCPANFYIAYSASPHSLPGDYKISNTLYTNALIKHIKNPNIKIEDLFKMVRRTVYQQSGGKQIPWETSSGIHFSF